MRTIRKNIILAVLSATILVRAFAMQTPVENLHEYTLENGLTVFAAENHNVPLVYIEIAVRTGAISQTPETAGLFHLYEHMIFKGNSLNPTAASVTAALSELGVSSWNGSTGVDRVNYFFTIPSDKLEEGLAFWNAAVRFPLMSPEEFESEKKVVMAEIEGDFSDPSSVYSYGINSRMFPDAPYKTDPRGSFESVSKATLDQMRDIQERFYIPCNSALFIGGDINPQETLELVKKIFGTWSNNENSAPVQTVRQNPAPLSQTEYCVIPYDRLPEDSAYVEIYYRGPDTAFDIEDTYSADYLGTLLSDPSGIFKTQLAGDEELAVPGTDYVYGGYRTVKANGLFSFGATLSRAQENLAGRAVKMSSLIQDKILPQIAADKSLYSKKRVRQIATNLNDDMMRSCETAGALMSNLSFWWSVVESSYYYTYIDNMRQVSQKDVASFIDRYFTDKKPLVAVLVNPVTYEKQKTAFDEASFTLITQENSVWWNESRFARDETKVAHNVSQLSPQDVYRVQDKTSSQKNEHVTVPVESAVLKNGIPVYVRKSDGHMSSVYVAVRGGTESLPEQMSGLESALFSVMAESSAKYDYESRRKISFETGSSVGSMCKMSGSALCVTTLDKYMPRMLGVLADGFINPVFEDKVMQNLLLECRTSVQKSQNNPPSLLFRTLMDIVYKGHPYETTVAVKEDSLASITAQNMKMLHKELMDPSRIFVVATGSVDTKSVVKILDKTLGRLERKESGSQQANPEIKPVIIEETAPVVKVHPSAAGTAYVARVFASPANTSHDFIPAVLASQIHSDIMFNVVREKYGACYSPSSSVIGSKAPVGTEILVNVSDKKNFASYMKEARTLMAQGKVIEDVSPDGTYVFASGAEKLDSYKNSYITSTYASSASSGGMAERMVYNLFQFNDIDYDKIQLEQVRNTTFEEVLDVFDRYWIKGNARWFAVCGDGDISF